MKIDNFVHSIPIQHKTRWNLSRYICGPGGGGPGPWGLGGWQWTLNGEEASNKRGQHLMMWTTLVLLLVDPFFPSGQKSRCLIPCLEDVIVTPTSLPRKFFIKKSKTTDLTDLYVKSRLKNWTSNYNQIECQNSQSNWIRLVGRKIKIQFLADSSIIY